jgi:hypothetical protein
LSFYPSPIEASRMPEGPAAFSGVSRTSSLRLTTKGVSIYVVSHPSAIPAGGNVGWGVIGGGHASCTVF